MRKAKVHCDKCDKWIEEDKVEFIDISEDISGRDVMVFRCPDCGTKQESFRVA